MKSYANVQGHPIHPALIPFPIAFLVGALLFDGGAYFWGLRAWATTGFHLLQLGVVAGFVAAVPGVLDFWKRVPPGSSGQRRAMRHGLANVFALLLFAFAVWLRRHGAVTSGSLLLELFGAMTLAYSGWLGGVLVSRNLISVDHRQANKGQWREARFTAKPGEPLVVATADELREDQMKLLIVNGRRIVLAKTARGFTAFDDRCTHRGGSLADGACVGGVVQCLWHGSQFDTATGHVKCGPARERIGVYEVRQQRGDVILVSSPE
jgi:uncharacterized membrane protein/nitrite reductase/ring-hydroxylating ferredoxin subunit